MEYPIFKQLFRRRAMGDLIIERVGTHVLHKLGISVQFSRGVELDLELAKDRRLGKRRVGVDTPPSVSPADSGPR